MKVEKLNWEYCECGCHQNVASIGDLASYGVFQHLRDKGGKRIDRCVLSIPSHGSNRRTFDSFEEAEAEALRHANKRLADLQRCLGDSIR